MSAASEAPFIVVGIDYGTTYSGAAWAKSGALDQVEVISQWSSQTRGATDSDKVPSEIAYNTAGRAEKWGFGLSSSDNPLQWVKLLLSPLSLGNMNNSEESVLEATRKQLKEMKKTVVDIIADYLWLLWKHILERLRVRLTAPVLDNMVLKIVLTVPAIWNHAAHQQMKTAAKKAGLLGFRACGKTELSLIAEPAAAALATYVDAGIKANPIMKVGDSFVVCDAGGGTVDLISYTVESFEPFRLTECVGATGDLCGAIYVDRAFKAHVKTFRKYMNSLSAEAEKRFMEKEWETNVKRNFDGTDGPWMVELPQKQQRGKLSALKSIVRDEKSNILQIEGDHLKQTFAEVVPKIVDLLKDQVEGIRQRTGSPPKVIILVGGFGENRYLLQQVEKQFSPSIIIQQPTRAWSAVCRGAVHRGVYGGDQIVANHISKYWYGTTYHDDWVEGKFHPDDKKFYKRRQNWIAVGQMDWYLKKHDDVKQVQSVSHAFSQLYATPRELKNACYSIYYSDHESPGQRLTSNIHKLCVIKLNLLPSQFTEFPVYKNPLGNEFREVNCTLRMHVSVSSVDWSIYCEGKQLDVTVEYTDVNPEAQVPTQSMYD